MAFQSLPPPSNQIIKIKYGLHHHRPMRIPRSELFDWLLEYEEDVKYNFGTSSIPGIRFSDLERYTGFEMDADFDLGKNTPFGYEPLRSVIVDKYGCDMGNVVTTTGGSEANFLTCMALLDKGDEVMVEQPGYEPMWLVPAMFGARLRKWERTFENDYRLDLDTLHELIGKKTKMIILTNLHNPSGALVSRSTMKAVSEIARDNDTYVLIDEIFLDASRTPTRSAAGLESVIVTSSITKVYGLGGLRTGWIVADRDTAKRVQTAKFMASAASPYLSEVINATVLLRAKEKILARFRATADRNVEIVKNWIEDKDGILEWIEPAGGIMCFPRYSLDMDSVSLSRELLEKGDVLVSPGAYFGMEGHFRLTFTVTEDVLREGLRSLGGVIEELADRPRPARS